MLNQEEDKNFMVTLDASTRREGVIQFSGNVSDVRRRFWILEKTGKVTFYLDLNKLTPGSRLTISGLDDTGRLSNEDYLK